VLEIPDHSAAQEKVAAGGNFGETQLPHLEPLVDQVMIFAPAFDYRPIAEFLGTGVGWEKGTCFERGSHHRCYGGDGFILPFCFVLALNKPW